MSLWRLMVFGVPTRNGALLRRLKFRPTKKNPASWWRTFTTAERDAAKSAIGHLRQARLRYVWSEVAAPRPPKERGDLQIIQIQTAAENRLARDALKRAQEKRRQAELAAGADANRRAKDALRRAKGDF